MMGSFGREENNIPRRDILFQRCPFPRLACGSFRFLSKLSIRECIFYERVGVDARQSFLIS